MHEVFFADPIAAAQYTVLTRIFRIKPRPSSIHHIPAEIVNPKGIWIEQAHVSSDVGGRTEDMGAVGLDAGLERDILPEEWVEKRCQLELVEKEGKSQIKR